MTGPTDDGELIWTEHGPRSRRFEDVYFSAADGLAESRAVFLQGVGLPQAWRGRGRFTVAELGFGTGLNIAALLQLWRAERPSGGQLSIFSVEAHPIPREAAARALELWPELEPVAAPLLHGWPQGRRGVHRVDLPGLDATLDLVVGEAAAALADWDGAADAWFLDGFAPARNPDMWREEVLALVATRSRPGARAATFTVAGQVRRGLTGAGFAVARQPGFGRKRERLEATLAGPAVEAAAASTAVIVGAGIAGAALARALMAQGVACTVIDAAGPGAGASGAPAALVTPRLDAGLGPTACLHAQAFDRAVTLIRETDAVIAETVLQVASSPRDPDRFARIAAWDGFAEGALRGCDPAATALRLQEASAKGALEMRDALVVQPRRVLDAWLAGCAFCPGRAAALQRADGGWRVLDSDGRELARAGVVCIALGAASQALLPELTLRPVRGQLEYTDALRFTGSPAAWGGYAIPTAEGGVMFGATHRRGDTDVEPRWEERQANLQTLAQARPALAAKLAAETLHSRAAIRATTPDHMPLAGPAPGRPGVYLLTGLGGRGFTLAPLLAEHIAADIVGAPSPLPRTLSALLRPDRFAPDPNLA